VSLGEIRGDSAPAGRKPDLQEEPRRIFIVFAAIGGSSCRAIPALRQSRAHFANASCDQEKPFARFIPDGAKAQLHSFISGE
jgi:hypothetical protein